MPHPSRSLALTFAVLLIGLAGCSDGTDGAGGGRSGKTATQRALADLHAGAPGTRAEAAHTLAKLRDPAAIAPLARTATHDAYAPVRMAATQALGHFDDPVARDALQTVLIDQDAPAIREAAGRSLAMTGPGAEKLAKLLEWPDTGVRLAAATGLAARQDPRALQTLLEIIRQPLSQAERDAFSRMREAGPGPDQTRQIIARLKRGPSLVKPRYPHEARKRQEQIDQARDWARDLLASPAEVQRVACNLYGHDAWEHLSAEGRQTEVQQLTGTLRRLHEPDSTVEAEELAQLAADAQAAARFESLPADRKQRAIDSEFAKQINELQRSQAERNANAAAFALGKLGTPPAAGAAIEMMTARDERLRSAGELALDEMGPAAVEPLLELARTDASARPRAVALLLDNSSDPATDALLRLLGELEPGQPGRDEILAGLAERPEPKVVAALIARAGSPHRSDRHAAAACVDQLLDRRYAPDLLAALDAAKPPARQAILKALGRMGTKDASDRLTREVTDGSGEDRVVAALALGRCRQPGVARTLWQELQSTKDRRLRSALSRGLIYQGPAAVNMLAGELGHADLQRRGAASQLLGRIGTPAVPALIDALREGSDEAKVMAIAALADIRDERALPALQEAARHENPAVRDAAKKAIQRIQP